MTEATARGRGLTTGAVALFLSYWAFQVVAAVMFKYGSMSEALWLPMFAAGNVIGGSSIIFMMRLYRSMNPNVVLGVCVGGAFLCAQTGVAIMFRSVLEPAQWLGLIAITAGMVALAAGGKEQRTG